MERRIRGHRQLKVWEQAVAFAVRIDEFVDALIKRRKYGLADQISRASISVPSNVAEGSARGSRIEYRRFVRISLGSLAELNTQLEICFRRGFLRPETHVEFCDQIGQIGRQLAALWTSLGRPGKMVESPISPIPDAQ